MSALPARKKINFVSAGHMNLKDIGSFGEKPDVKKFGEETFWKDRYEGKIEEFEWFVSLKECLNQNEVFKQMLQSRVAQKAKILEIGF